MPASVGEGMLRVAAETAPRPIPAPHKSKAWTNIAGTAITERMLLEGWPVALGWGGGTNS